MIAVGGLTAASTVGVILTVGVASAMDLSAAARLLSAAGTGSVNSSFAGTASADSSLARRLARIAEEAAERGRLQAALDQAEQERDRLAAEVRRWVALPWWQRLFA